MAGSAKIVAFAAFSLMLVPIARAQDAQRCEGTLCDLYYANKGNAPDATAAKPAAASPGLPPGATPVTAPSGNYFNNLLSGTGSLLGGTPSNRPPPPASEPATASNSYMHMGTNGMLGGGNERCSGTLCDLYYRGSPPEPAGQQQASAAGAAQGSAAPPVVHRHIVHESETRPKCSSPNADPWRCFR